MKAPVSEQIDNLYRTARQMPWVIVVALIVYALPFAIPLALIATVLSIIWVLRRRRLLQGIANGTIVIPPEELAAADKKGVMLSAKIDYLRAHPIRLWIPLIIFLIALPFAIGAIVDALDR